MKILVRSCLDADNHYGGICPFCRFYEGYGYRCSLGSTIEPHWDPPSGIPEDCELLKEDVVVTNKPEN